MTDKINIQSAYNGMLSGKRNMFLTSSIGMAMLGFSERFQHKESMNLMKWLGIATLIISVITGLITAYDFNNAIDRYVIEQGRNYDYLERWESWNWIIYIYSIILITIITIYISRKIL